jgi:hypothetical protein
MEPSQRTHPRPSYVHIQTGTALIFTLGFTLMGITLGMVGSHLNRYWVLPAVVVAFIILLFHSLTVTVDDECVEIMLGNRWIKRAVPLSLIEHARLVENPALTGWGLRRTGDTWTYAVGGREAVELELKGTSTCIRIGSDDAEGLLKAILTRLPKTELSA